MDVLYRCFKYVQCLVFVTRNYDNDKRRLNTIFRFVILFYKSMLQRPRVCYVKLEYMKIFRSQIRKYVREHNLT